MDADRRRIAGIFDAMHIALRGNEVRGLTGLREVDADLLELRALRV
jgi:hypothetical protein